MHGRIMSYLIIYRQFQRRLLVANELPETDNIRVHANNNGSIVQVSLNEE